MHSSIQFNSHTGTKMPWTLFIVNFVYFASKLINKRINSIINHCTSIPPMQKSTISTQINQVDIKKYSSNRKVDAVMTKHTAPATLRFMTSSSESSLAVPALDSYPIKDDINTISHNYNTLYSNRRAEKKISAVMEISLLKLWRMFRFLYQYQWLSTGWCILSLKDESFQWNFSES